MKNVSIFQQPKLERITELVGSNFHSDSKFLFPEIFEMIQETKELLTNSTGEEAFNLQNRILASLNYFANEYKGEVDVLISLEKEDPDGFPVRVIQDESSRAHLRKLIEVYVAFSLCEDGIHEAFLPALKLQDTEDRLYSNPDWMKRAFDNFKFIGVYYLVERKY
tara:strand:- start:6830 stop:7324 length:495 start_codon:yes stop_codon:yes gene_type:complete